MSANEIKEPELRKKRIDSIDAFRGFTILAMIFVIQVAAGGYKHLPLTFSHFGSAPVSTFFHAAEDGNEEEWEAVQKGKKFKKFHKGEVNIAYEDGTYYVTTKFNNKIHMYERVQIFNPRPSRVGDEVIMVYHSPEGVPEFRGVGNGCTFTDLVAPFFVFIVGICIPLSRRRRGAEWWHHVMVRTIGLIVLGVIYISLILSLSYWWGILQAIGIAYFMGAAAMKLPKWGRWVLVAGIAIVHAYLSWHVGWWLEVGRRGAGFLRLTQLDGDLLRPLIVHCTPWASISYGLITIVGTLLGDALVSRDKYVIARQSILIGVVFCTVGYILHRFVMPMNKDLVSSSYSIFTSGVGAFTFLIFYWIMDVWGLKRWAWFLCAFGANALLAYFMQPVVRIFLWALGFKEYFAGWAGWSGVLVGLGWTAILWCVVLWFNHKKIFLKI